MPYKQYRRLYGDLQLNTRVILKVLVERDTCCYVIVYTRIFSTSISQGWYPRTPRLTTTLIPIHGCIRISFYESKYSFIKKYFFGHNGIATFIDWFSKYIYFVPSSVNIILKEFAHLYISIIMARYGIPTLIISAHDLQFPSKFRKALIDILGYKWATSSAY